MLYLMKRMFSSSEHPYKRIAKIVGYDLKRLKNYFKPPKTTVEIEELEKSLIKERDERYFPKYCDVLIIGGGGIGSSTAFWLKHKGRDGLNVVVVDKESDHPPAFPMGELTQTFSLPENIQMSLFGAEFIKDYKKYLGEENNPNFTPYGHVRLASEEGAEELIKNSRLQNELGAKNELLSPEKLKAKFPWIITEGVAIATQGLEKEGCFDPYKLLMGYKKKATEYGALFVNGEVTGFEFREQEDLAMAGASEGKYKAPDKVLITLASGEKKEIKFAICVIAAGKNSREVGKLANIGNGCGILDVSIPVIPRRYNLFSLSSTSQDSQLPIPFFTDTSGTFFKRDALGGEFMAGHFSKENDFENDIKPFLSQRISTFDSMQCDHCYERYCEENLFDSNGILGPHPLYHNVYVVTAFNKFGLQLTPALGRTLCELIVDGQFRTIDLTRLGFDRIVVDYTTRETMNA